MTRVFVVAPADRASTFVQDELLTPEYGLFVEVVGEVSERHRCPKCLGNTIKRQEGQYGAWWACTNYPLCDGKLPSCPSCKQGGLVAASQPSSQSTYRCTDCRFQTTQCPKCRKGMLMPRTGRYGDFLACSDWRGGEGCTYTRNA